MHDYCHVEIMARFVQSFLHVRCRMVFRHFNPYFIARLRIFPTPSHLVDFPPPPQNGPIITEKSRFVPQFFMFWAQFFFLLGFSRKLDIVCKKSGVPLFNAQVKKVGVTPNLVQFFASNAALRPFCRLRRFAPRPASAPLWRWLTRKFDQG